MPQPRKPNKVHRLQGTAQPCRHGKEAQDVEFSSALPECPGWLDDEAQQEWWRIVNVMREHDLLSGADFAVMAAYCAMFGRFKRACQHQEKFTAADFCQFRYLMNELGLSPAARSKLRLPEQKSKGNSFGTI